MTRGNKENRQTSLSNKTFYLPEATIHSILESGPERPVLLLHGNSSRKEIWSHQIEALRVQGRAVLAPDLPGHGQSSDARHPEFAYSFPGYAAVVSSLLDMLQWPSIDVVGWSLGGHIGLELLASDDRIRSLFIVGTPPANPSRKALESAFHDSACMQLTGKRHLSECEALAYAADTVGGMSLVTDTILAGVRRTDPNARHFMFENAINGVGYDQRRLVEERDTRLCVAHGENDPFVRLDYLVSIEYRNLWRDRVVIFPGVGHAPHWQCPAKFNEVLDNFLSEERTEQDVIALRH